MAAWSSTLQRSTELLGVSVWGNLAYKVSLSPDEPRFFG
jgi:hypothetical protein